ncbi:hypothetical protein SAMN04490207_5445 [Pseudomonas gessardii]|uniref:Type III secretion effector protein n=1 Tax=Pseudomonas gessardii TaxID=78544 RepID=A0A7Y1QKE8_9PSED|nr:hypothetical protein [Pseudomonas gessardii]MRU51156.1 hypothetical protein [Pseudomonas gessardii]NNA94609.1 hypothetical protein [Pseudomonas gessardii]ONH42588.1 hypothetical protein BLL38_12350 [Pseudomonas gessardii]SDR35174.1 hypothetical protein SAMN04490207_5445 [Pseudomonas gessardii]
MGSISTEHHPGGAHFAFDPVIEPRRAQEHPAGAARGRAGSSPMPGTQAFGAPGINFSPVNSGGARQAFSYDSFASSDSFIPRNNFSSFAGTGLVRAGVKAGKDTGDVFAGFSQGKNGNCATVSAIKAMIQRYGKKETDLFKEVKETQDGYHITLKDGSEVSLTRQELEEAGRHAGFNGNDPEMKKTAILAYAVSGKKAQEADHEGSKFNFSKALDSLENGEYTKDAFIRLGMKDHIRQGTVNDLENGQLGIIEKDVAGPGTAHSMVVIGGVEEHWGNRGGRVEGGTMSGNGREVPENVILLT